MAAAPKSILRKPQYPATKDASREEHNHEVALYHANLIQQRKDIELQILFDLEKLIDYPLDLKGHDASNPSPSDARSFKELIYSFRPSDYDDLIEERNIGELCGYALCQNKRVKDTRGGKYRILGKYGKGNDFRVVEKGELDKWCSNACAKRAMYVRVQLSETPAWERSGGFAEPMQLLDEPKSVEEKIVQGVEKMNLDTPEEPGKKQDRAGLSLERGDRGLAARRGLVAVDIVEKDVTAPPQAPSLEAELSGRLNTLHLGLEGHTTAFSTERQRTHHDGMSDAMEQDDVDTDWDI